MFGINTWKLGIFIIVSWFFSFISVSQAEQTYDVTDCGSMTFTINSETDELAILSFDFKGIARSYSVNKVFDNCTVFYVGIARRTLTTTTAYGYGKYLDPDGDFVIMECIREGDVTTMKFLQGTGKWKGIQGGGKLRRIATGKPIVPGTSQYCTRHYWSI
jgi:hypothetical protein